MLALQAAPVMVVEQLGTLQELWNGFIAHRVAYLDVQKIAVADTCGLSAVGLCAHLTRNLNMMPGDTHKRRASTAGAPSDDYGTAGYAAGAAEWLQRTQRGVPGSAEGGCGRSLWPVTFHALLSCHASIAGTPSDSHGTA